MSSSAEQSHNRIVVDSVHGDIGLDDAHWRIIDTPSFQRLRRLKSLGMAHITYPNATHTRFAHSIGTFHVMDRLLQTGDIVADLDRDVMAKLRVAALLHDIGHYPYSHLMEGVDAVKLTEEVIGDGPKATLEMSSRAYPSHERVGELIVTSQPDLVRALGGAEKAEELAQYLGKARVVEPKLTQLISSSLDMDRLDYLLRDSQATGVPYGNVDINYLLRNVCRAKDGTVCITEKGVPAADHFLLARFFMHRTVYYHKTIFGMEEACKQLLRRIRNKPDTCEKYGLPADGEEVEDIVRGGDLYRFTDAFVDEIVHRACGDDDPLVSLLAKSMISCQASSCYARRSGYTWKDRPPC